MKAAAALAAAAALSFVSLSGCTLFRPADGSDWDTETTASTYADTTAPTTSADTTPTTTRPVETTPAHTTAAPPVVSREKRVSILAVGDNIIHEAVFTDAKNRAADGAAYDFLPMYNGIAEEIGQADIAFINHETPIAGDGYAISGYPTFNAPREAGQALVDVGFDVINLANNHILDKQVKGARNTVEYVQSLPVTELGVYLDKEDYERIRVTEVNGIRIAWVAFCYGSNNPYDPASAAIIMPLMNDDAAITARISDAREVADFVIVSAHFGPKEDVTTESAEQKRLAGVMAKAGADVILGHHPHVLQGMEWITQTDGRRTLVAYSLGNLLSTQHYARNMVGGMLNFDIVMDTKGQCTIESPVMNITVNHYSMDRDGLQLYMYEDYTEDLASAHGCKKYTSAFSLKWIDTHVRSIIPEEFLPAYFE